MNAAAPSYFGPFALTLNRVLKTERGRRVAELLAVASAYVLAGEIGLAVPFTNSNVSPLWYPAGLALAGVILCGYRVWPAIALGALIVNVFSPLPNGAAVGIAVGNTLGALFGGWLLKRLADFEPRLCRLRDVLALSIAGFCGAAVSASVGIGALSSAGVEAWSRPQSAWLIWWLGDALGVLIVTPLILTFTSLKSLPRSGRRELACLLVIVFAGATLIFNSHFGTMRADAFAFGIFPLILWAALRFETKGVTLISLLVSLIAIIGTVKGLGPFIRVDAQESATVLQSFLGITTLAGIILASVVTERTKLIRQQSATETARYLEKSYGVLVESSYEGIWKLTPALYTSFVNARMAELLGCTVAAMRTRSVFDFLFPDDRAAERSCLEMSRHGATQPREVRYRKEDGTEFWAQVATSPLFDRAGDFDGIVAMVRDLTEEKRQAVRERGARETIELLSQAVEQTGDSIMITTPGGVIEYVNAGFEDISGYSREEAVGNSPNILRSGVHDKDFYTAMWKQILAGETFRGTLANRKKSGELYWCQQTITPIRDSAGRTSHFVSVLKDITQLRRQQEQDLRMHLAREVQQHFYEGASARVAGFEIGIAACPAHETGGDYLDVFPLPDGRICIGIGDVSGHGLDSALMMALTRAYVRAFSYVEGDPARLLSSVNRMLVHDLPNDRYVTLLLVCLDAKNNSLTYASAGHIPAFLMSDSGEIDSTLESSGVPLGLFAEAQFLTTTVPIRHRQTLILLTDGITEATAQQEDVQFGSQRAVEYVRAHQGKSARELADGICAAAREFTTGQVQFDDLTNVVVKVA